MKTNKLIPTLTIAAIAALLTGCSSPGVKNPSGIPVTRMNSDEQGFVAGTGVESQAGTVGAVDDDERVGTRGVPGMLGAVAGVGEDLGQGDQDR